MKKKASTYTQGIALPNEKADAANPLAFRIPMPYGEYPYGELVCPDKVKRTCMQSWNRAAAERCAGAIPEEGIPIYAGHPDVPDLAAKYPSKAALGWATAIEVADDGATIVGEWNEAAPGKGFKFFSPYFIGDLIPESAKSCRLEIGEIQSVGLVNRPNIKSFRLANEESQDDNPTEGDLMDLKKLAAKLGLPETATEAEIEAKLASMTSELTAAKVASDTAKTETENAQKEIAAAKAACANERAAHIATLLNGAVARGAITPAGRAAWETQLVEDFDKGSAALANEETKIKTKSALAGGGDDKTKPGGLTAIANEKIKKNPGLTFEEAWKLAKSEAAAKQ